MKKVANINAQEVFQALADGMEVYALNPRNDGLINLVYENVAKIKKVLKDERNTAFFVIVDDESEDGTDGN